MTNLQTDSGAGMQVRQANAADQVAIGRIAEAAGLFPANMLAPMIDGYLRKTASDIWLMAVDGDGPAGFGFCRPEPLAEGTWNLLAIAVEPQRQRQGGGSALLAAVEARLRQDGARLLIIETSDADDQKPAAAFYRARGYREEARISDFWAPGIAKLVFWKAIA